jgi:hypothetical protein
MSSTEYPDIDSVFGLYLSRQIGQYGTLHAAVEVVLELTRDKTNHTPAQSE